MRARKLKFGTPVQVAWIDSMTQLGWQMASNETAELAQIASIGYVVNTTPGALVLTTSLNTKGIVLDPVSIPWKSITAFQVLNKKRKKE